MSFCKCDFANERTRYRNKSGYCPHKRIYCNGNGDVFSENIDPDTVEKVDRKDICKQGSIFGNYYIVLTDEQIEALRHGEVFALLNEEYNIFIAKG